MKGSATSQSQRRTWAEVGSIVLTVRCGATGLLHRMVLHVLRPHPGKKAAHPPPPSEMNSMS
eukprot:393698-Rhodomonas_salina.2